MRQERREGANSDGAWWSCHTLRARRMQGDAQKHSPAFLLEEVLPSAPLPHKCQEDSALQGGISAAAGSDSTVTLFAMFNGLENESLAVTRRGN